MLFFFEWVPCDFRYSFMEKDIYQDTTVKSLNFSLALWIERSLLSHIH